LNIPNSIKIEGSPLRLLEKLTMLRVVRYVAVTLLSFSAFNMPGVYWGYLLITVRRPDQEDPSRRL
jgi:hypothetical protein